MARIPSGFLRRPGSKGCFFPALLALAFFSAVSPILAVNDSQAPVAREREYLLSVDDLLQVNVYGEEDLSMEIRINRDGTINYPLLGNIKASGLTARQLEARISYLLEKDYLVNPQVNVIIKEYGKISILGQVKIPGSYQMKGGMTFTQVMAVAGGFTEEADVSKIKIMRVVDNKKETLIVDMDKIMNKQAPDIEVRPNDTIIVGEYGNFSVVGQVAKPGIYKLKKKLSIIDAISMAGGFSPTAAQNGTKIIRVEGGQKRVISVPVSRIMKGESVSKEVSLKAEDVIVVPESFF